MILRGRWVESLLAGVAVLVAGWPIGDLVETQPWVWPLVWIMVLVVIAGGTTRTLGSPRWLVVLTQLLTALTALAWFVQRGGGGGTTSESFVAATVRLVEEGAGTIATYSVPAPATAGLVVIVLSGMVLLALVIDALAVTFAAPAMAGVPLLLMCALTASSSGEALHPRYFLAIAAVWLVLIARQGRSSARAWVARAAEVTSVDAKAATAGASRRSGTLARMLGVVALGVAVVVPGLLPHLPPTVLVDGLSLGAGEGDITFIESLDLSQDLADRSRAPVIRYRTDAHSPPPLRITASARYEDGRWLPAQHPDDRVVIGPPPELPGDVLEARDVETRSATVTVIQNSLRAPQLAVPHLSTELDLGETTWRWDPVGQVPLTADQPSDYRATFTEVSGATPLPEEIGDPAAAAADIDELLASLGDIETITYEMTPDGEVVEVRQVDRTWADRLIGDGDVMKEIVSGAIAGTPGALDVDPSSAELVTALAAEVVGEATNQLDVAAAIQQYLRSPEFTYSLTLADPVEGEGGEPLDPLSHFLTTKQGYCTQFATAMVMMARSQDIPARLAVGFLPGQEGADGTRTIVAADAHAWPELYITGLGWTRFEPTPSARSGSAPFYPTPVDAAPEAAPEVPEEADPTPETVVPDSLTEQGRREDVGWFTAHGATLRTGAVVAAVVLVLLSVVPLAGRWARHRPRRQRGATARIEGEWAAMVASLEDLGVAPRPELTPRGQTAYYDDELAPDATSRDALRRAAHRLEAARYTAAGVPVETMAEDVRRVVDWRRTSLPRGRRIAHALFPLSGRRRLRLAEGPATGRGPSGAEPRGRRPRPVPMSGGGGARAG